LFQYRNIPPSPLRNRYVSGSLKEDSACKCDELTKVNIWVQIAILKHLNSELVWENPSLWRVNCFCLGSLCPGACCRTRFPETGIESWVYHWVRHVVICHPQTQAVICHPETVVCFVSCRNSSLIGNSDRYVSVDHPVWFFVNLRNLKIVTTRRARISY